MKRFVMLSVAMVLAGICAQAQNLDALPRYHPGQPVSGTIRIWGNEYMSDVTRYWKEGFQKYHPAAKFEISLEGTATAMPGIYNGLADLALLGRDANYADKNGFLHLLQYNPLRLDLTTGSLSVSGKSYALVVYVHKDNPISKLTLAQLGAIFGCEQRPGMDKIQTWGQLGLNAEWRNKSINLYGYDIKTGTGAFFLRAILGDSHKLNWGNFKEFKDIENADGSIYESGQQIVDALRRDRYGIAVSGARYASPELKAVALASQEGGSYFQANRETLIARTYPLTRITYAFLNQPPGKPVDPKVKEFLRYVFSREGQEDIVRDGGYLPLNQDSIREQLKKLE
jgi:phosphate transport system substrate-binding protein